MPIMFIDYTEKITVGDVIDEFWNETGLVLEILNGKEPVLQEITIHYLQHCVIGSIPGIVALNQYRGTCIIDIAKSICEIEELFYNRYLLMVRVLCDDGEQPKLDQPLKYYSNEYHPSRYCTEGDMVLLRERFLRIYSEAWEQITQAEDCLEKIKALRKESDTLAINGKIAYRLSDVNDDPIPDDVYTQFFLVNLEGQVSNSIDNEHLDSSDYYLDDLFAHGLTPYDILRLNYRIILSIDWGTCRRSQQNGTGLRY